MLLTRRFALAALAAVLALPAPIAARADVQETFTRLLEDVQAFRRAGFTLPRPAGVPGRYSRRMEDVSAEHYAREAIARLQAFRQHIDQPDRQPARGPEFTRVPALFPAEDRKAGLTTCSSVRWRHGWRGIDTLKHTIHSESYAHYPRPPGGSTR